MLSVLIKLSYYSSQKGTFCCLQSFSYSFVAMPPEGQVETSFGAAKRMSFVIRQFQFRQKFSFCQFLKLSVCIQQCLLEDRPKPVPVQLIERVLDEVVLNDFCSFILDGNVVAVIFKTQFLFQSESWGIFSQKTFPPQRSPVLSHPGGDRGKQREFAEWKSVNP